MSIPVQYTQFNKDGYAITTAGNNITNLHLSKVSCQDLCGFHGLLQDFTDKYFMLSQAVKYNINPDFDVIVSGSICRCINHNIDINGSPTSLHLYGKAGDLTISSFNTNDLKIMVKLAVNIFPCVIYYPYKNFVHCDIRKLHKQMTQTKTELKSGLLFDLV